LASTRHFSAAEQSREMPHQFVAACLRVGLRNNQKGHWPGAQTSPQDDAGPVTTFAWRHDHTGRPFRFPRTQRSKGLSSCSSVREPVFRCPDTSWRGADKTPRPGAAMASRSGSPLYPLRHFFPTNGTRISEKRSSSQSPIHVAAGTDV
jgi:hypothetical protein